VRAAHPVLAAALVALAAAPAGAQTAMPSRADLDRFETALDAAVDKINPGRPLPVLGVATGTRAYPIPGVGIVFVMPPRVLPGQRHVLMLRRSGPASGAATKAPTWIESERPQLAGKSTRKVPDAPGEAEAKAPAPALAGDQSPERADIERELREVEELAREYQLEVERSSGQAEQALLSLTLALREARDEGAAAAVPPAPPAAPAAPSGEAPSPPPAPAPPPPPWRYWFQAAPERAAAPPRSAQQVLADVRSAVGDVIAAQAPLLRGLQRDAVVVVTVDFVPGLLMGGSARDDHKGLVVKVRKRDVDDYHGGRISREELRKRTESLEF